jgi:hypothetical protein
MENFNQGRRQDQYESSAKVMSAGCLGFLGIIIVSLIISVIS